MSLVSKVMRVRKPGLLGASLVAIAIAAAATYTVKLSAQLESTLDEVDTAQNELAVIGTQYASTALELEMLTEQRNTVLEHLRTVMHKDIELGKYDDAVIKRAYALEFTRVAE